MSTTTLTSRTEPRRWERGDPAKLASVAEDLLGAKVARLTAPGGRRRASLRIHLSDGRRVIATRRASPAQSRLEAALLAGLEGAGGHVPRLLGQADGFVFQEDAGGRRLSAELALRQGSAQTALAEDAIHALEEIRRQAAVRGLTSVTEPIALDRRWLLRFLTAPHRLARAFSLAPPALDLSALGAALRCAPRQLVKWDARPGNAALGEGGKVIWYDWSAFGRRAGVEDIATLIADEYWPLAPEVSLAAVAAVTPDRGPEARPLLIRFATCQIAARLLELYVQASRTGWQPVEDLMRYDLVGAAPGFAERLASHGAEMAALDWLTAPAAPLFEAVARADWPRPTSDG